MSTNPTGTRRFLPDAFSFKTAWRDARSQYKSLMLYASGIVAGVAALVAILSFRSDVLLTVDDQARELLGADLEIYQNQPFEGYLAAFIDSLGGEQSTTIEFNSMVIYGSGVQTRLSQVRAIEGGFPLYGSISTDPPEAAQIYQQQNSALVDRPAMQQFGLSPGDSIRVGNRTLEIAGVILEVPGESAAVSLIGPRVIIPQQVLEGSNLLERGSRVQYKTFFQFDDERDMAAITAQIRDFGRDDRVRYNTVETRKQDFSQIIDSLTRFLGMIGFVALLLGGLGVTSAIYVYIKRKSGMVATLRCLGASSRQTIGVFSLQVIFLGFAGAAAGALLGVGVQRFLPVLFTDFLPFQIIQQISWPAILLGGLVGILVSLGLALLPLASINNIPPLLTIRNVDFAPLAHVGTGVKILSGVICLAILIISLAFLLDDFLAATAFIVGLIVAVLLLMATAKLLIHAVKRMRLKTFSYTWRQGIANLFRPNNQTTVLVTTLGMGMLLIGILYLSQEMILERIAFQTGDEQPNLVFYDIQVDQNQDFMDIAEREGARIIESVPIVSMRLAEINGRTIREIRGDENREVSGWALTREYRVTYRDRLNDAETIVQGDWIGTADGMDSVVPISLGDRMMEELNVNLGDTLVYDVQGVDVTTVIASVREIDFQRPQPNFFVLFPEGVLEGAPQFHALVLNAPDQETVNRIQMEVARTHPNVSAIDVGLVLESVRQFLDKVALAVQFMALFSILTGLIVMAGAIAISRFQRIREAVLLRTIGASRTQVRGIQFVEYIWLGSLACLTGLLLAFVSSWLLARLFFDLIFVPNVPALIIASAVVVLLTIIVGFLNLRGVLNKKPLEILRLGTE